MTYKRNSIALLGVLSSIILVNLIAKHFFVRVDLTHDQRYTISSTTKKIVSQIEAPLIIDVFLEGDLPTDFKILKQETQQILHELKNLNTQLKVNYIDPIEDETTRQRNITQLTNAGLQPYVSSTKINGKLTQQLIFAWAFASYNGNTIKIPLLKTSITESLKTQITNSIQSLEYEFADGFKQLTQGKQKRIAILKGNGELDDIYITDFIKTIKPYYNIAPFTLDSVAKQPTKTLKQLEQYDLIIAAKPTQPFTEKEKLVLDQYIMQGGHSIWLTESVAIDKDSLYRASGSSVATINNLNLTDFFFSYGARVNPSIVKDIYSAPIMLSIGEGSQAQLQPIQWPYSPLAAANPKHPITKNLNLVKFDFANPIDTLKNAVKKTILLQSSPQSKLQGVPSQVKLADIKTTPNPSTYNLSPQNLAVLLEGNFKSAYKNRILPFQISQFKSQSKTTKMVIISDGNIIQNDVFKNKPQPLGFDKLTGKSFGNKSFLLNTINYMLDDSGLLNIRVKDIQVSYLSSETIQKNKLYWQVINVLIPLILLLCFGLGFRYYRKQKYTT